MISEVPIEKHKKQSTFALHSKSSRAEQSIESYNRQFVCHLKYEFLLKYIFVATCELITHNYNISI